jgi:hypothetical protein
MNKWFSRNILDCSNSTRWIILSFLFSTLVGAFSISISTFAIIFSVSKNITFTPSSGLLDVMVLLNGLLVGIVIISLISTVVLRILWKRRVKNEPQADRSDLERLKKYINLIYP